MRPSTVPIESAASLNRALGRTFEEEAIYRIDHYLGKEVVQGLRSSFARKASEELTCPTHKKDCCTQLYKTGAQRGDCEWYRLHERSVQRDRDNYFGLNKNSGKSVHFRNSDDDDDDDVYVPASEQIEASPPQAQETLKKVYEAVGFVAQP